VIGSPNKVNGKTLAHSDRDLFLKKYLSFKFKTLSGIDSILPVSSPFYREKGGDDGKKGVKRSPTRFQLRRIESD
jgi:hypothetical protein